jgi:hypothetical protein
MIDWNKGPGEGECPGGPPDCYAGDRYLVLVACHDRRANHDFWDSAVIVATEDGWDDPAGDSWCAWDWGDVSWWVKLDRHVLPPLPKKWTGQV